VLIWFGNYFFKIKKIFKHKNQKLKYIKRPSKAWIVAFMVAVSLEQKVS